MSSSQVSALTTQSNQRFVRTVASRPYPTFARPFVHFDPEDLPPLDLTGQIEAAIRSRMTLAPGWGVYQDIQELMDDYAQSMQVVRKATADVRQMIESLLRLNTCRRRPDVEPVWRPEMGQGRGYLEVRRGRAEGCLGMGSPSRLQRSSAAA